MLPGAFVGSVEIREAKSSASNKRNPCHATGIARISYCKKNFDSFVVSNSKSRITCDGDLTSRNSHHFGMVAEISEILAMQPELPGFPISKGISIVLFFPVQNPGLRVTGA